LAVADCRTRLFICLARYAGLRESEALQIRWKDVDLQEGFIWVMHDPDKGQRTKNGCSRKAVLTPEIRNALQEWAVEVPENEWVFPAPDGPSVHQRRIKRALSLAYKKAGIDPNGAPAHNLRHCFGTALAEKGCSAATIQVLMGHSEIRTSSRYLHPGFEAAMNEFENRLFTYCSPNSPKRHNERSGLKVISALGGEG